MSSLSSFCIAARELFPAYLDETLAREERSSVRAHLADCAACRREASALDPALLFAALPAPPVSEADTARILAAVRSGIALKSTEKRIGSAADMRPRRSATGRTVMTAAAAAAAVALAWSLAPSAPRLDSPRVAPVSASRSASAVPASLRALPPANRADALEPATETENGQPFISTGGPFRAADPTAGSSMKVGGSITGSLPADATVYDWNPGGGQPRVVWIVGRSLDI